jgi:hypothetical protein
MTHIIHHFDLPAKSPEWAALHANLSAWGYSQFIMPHDERYAPLPTPGEHDLAQQRVRYYDEAGSILHDWTIYPISARRRVGYWIELPDGETPCPPDPASGAGASNLQQAVAWLQAVSGSTQVQAAEKFGVKQSNLSVALRKSRRI